MRGFIFFLLASQLMVAQRFHWDDISDRATIRGHEYKVVGSLRDQFENATNHLEDWYFIDHNTWPSDSIIDPDDLTRSVEQFVRYAKTHSNMYFAFGNRFKIKFVDDFTHIGYAPDALVAGASFNSCDRGIEIEISRLVWDYYDDNFSPARAKGRKMRVIWHELGHALLNLDHSCHPNEIMATSNAALAHCRAHTHQLDVYGNFVYQARRMLSFQTMAPLLPAYDCRSRGWAKRNDNQIICTYIVNSEMDD